MQSQIAFPSVTQLRPLLQTLAVAAVLLTLQPAHATPLDDASQAFKAGQHAKALELVDKHLSSQPKDAQGRFLKGLILAGLNKQAEAIAVFRKLTEDYPELPEPYNNLAVIYAQQKQYDKAREALEQAIRTHPAYATAHENLGDIYSRLASQAYGKALSLDASNASAQTKLAMINELVGTGKTSSVASAPAKAPAPTILASAKPAEPPKPTPAASVTAKPAVSEPKPAETRPVPPPASTQTATVKPAGLEDEIAAAIDAWLAAWSNKDVKGYLAFYAPDFETPRGLSRKDWETERAQRIGKPGRIEVSREKLSIKAEGADKATVRFRQHYRSASFKASSGKTLVLVKRGGNWLILKEQTG